MEDCGLNIFGLVENKAWKMHLYKIQYEKMDTKGMRQTRNEFVRQKSDTVAHLSPFNVVVSNG